MYILCVKPEAGTVGIAEQYLSIYNDYYVLDTDDGVTELVSGVDIYNYIQDFGHETTIEDLEEEGLDTTNPYAYEEDTGEDYENDDYEEVKRRLSKIEMQHEKFEGIRIYLDEPEFICVSHTLYTLLHVDLVKEIGDDFFVTKNAVSDRDNNAVFASVFLDLYRDNVLSAKQDAFTDFDIWYVNFANGVLEIRAVGMFFHSVENCDAVIKYNLPDFWRIESLSIDGVSFDASNQIEYKAKLAKHVLASKDMSFSTKRELSYKACIECIEGDK